jgi:hypothetical protein
MRSIQRDIPVVSLPLNHWLISVAPPAFFASTRHVNAFYFVGIRVDSWLKKFAENCIFCFRETKLCRQIV